MRAIMRLLPPSMLKMSLLGRSSYKPRAMSLPLGKPRSGRPPWFRSWDVSVSRPGGKLVMLPCRSGPASFALETEREVANAISALDLRGGEAVPEPEQVRPDGRVRRVPGVREGVRERHPGRQRLAADQRCHHGAGPRWQAAHHRRPVRDRKSVV